MDALAAGHEQRARTGPWLWGREIDLLVFGGSAALALCLVALRRVLRWPEELPPWGFVLFVIGIDVAHVYSTLFRTYLDGDELRRHPWRYTLAPLGAYAAGLALYRNGAASFWSVLAYMALFHFVRQQVGWVALYRSRSGGTKVDAWIDAAAVYAATLYPVTFWHAHLDTARFHWFVPGDFVDLARFAERVLPLAEWVWGGALSVFLLRQIQVFLRESIVNPGKIIVVGTTALLWHVGIVTTNSDFDFTVTNVIAHGVPYIALLWAYAKARQALTPRALGSRIVGAGLGLFLALLLCLALLEEWAWGSWVWLEPMWLIGGPATPAALAWVVPLLTVPQATHYLLDGVLWRRRDTRENVAQRLALGYPAQ